MRVKQYLPHFLLLLVSLAAISRLFLPYPPFADQEIVLQPFSAGWPAYTDGVTSRIIFGILNFVLPDHAITVNIAARVFAGTLFLLAAALLSSQLKPGLLVYLLLLSSKFYYLWLSTEVLAGALIMLFWWAYLAGYLAISTVCLAIFSFIKPDLLLPGLLMLAFLLYRQRSAARKMLPGIAIFVLLLLTGFTGQNTNRSLTSLKQHFAVLVAPLQITANSLDPWENSEAYITPVFGTVDSLTDMIFGHPDRYMDFVFLSMAASIREALLTGLLFITILAIFVLPVLLAFRKDIVILAGLQASNLIPIILLSFLHDRYQSRFYPTVVVIIFSALPFLSRTQSKWVLRAAVALAGIQLVIWGGYSLTGIW